MGLVDKVKDLIALMNENNLSEIEIEEEATKIRLKKNSLNLAQTNVQLPSVDVSLQEGATKYLTTKEEGGDFSEIVAPMVGTFYSNAPGEYG